MTDKNNKTAVTVHDLNDRQQLRLYFLIQLSEPDYLKYKL